VIAASTGGGPLGTSSVVLGNLVYVIGAIVMIVILTLVIVLRQRKPKSVEANMESFHKGLRALAPSDTSPKRGSVAPAGRRVERPRVERRSPVRAAVEPVAAVDLAADPTAEHGAG
jgi:hypothetical protein